jgi:hypothetical protein
VNATVIAQLSGPDGRLKPRAATGVRGEGKCMGSSIRGGTGPTRASAAEAVDRATAASRIDLFMPHSCLPANGRKLNVIVEKSAFTFDFAPRPP